MGKTSSVVTHASHRTSSEQPVSQRRIRKGKLAGRTLKQETTSSAKGMSVCSKVALAFAAVVTAGIVAAGVHSYYKFDLRTELLKGQDIVVQKHGDTAGSYQLSSAHAASVLNDHRVLHALHERGFQLDMSDELGFTPLHYMAIKGDTEGVHTLLGWGASPYHRNAMGSTYMDILRLNEPFRPSTDLALDPTLISAHNYHNTDVDPKCLPKGVTFITENVAHPDQLFQMLGKVRSHVNDRNFPPDKTEVTRYEAFKRSPPHLSIQPITHDDAGNPLNLGPTLCGVIAKQEIQKGDVIGEYAGEMFADDAAVRHKGGEYLWGDWPAIDSGKFRSVGAMINDGFPNAVVHPWFASGKIGLDGLPYRKMVVAIDHIPAGGEIIITYGHQYPRPPHWVELRHRTIREFIKQNGWQNLFDNFYMVAETKQGDMDKMNKFLSLLFYPSNLAKLAQEGLISQHDFSLIESVAMKLNTHIDLGPLREALAKASECDIT